jgi:hypothetical protein
MAKISKNLHLLMAEQVELDNKSHGFKLKQGDCAECQGCLEPSTCLNMNATVRRLNLTCYDLLGDDTIVVEFPSRGFERKLSILINKATATKGVNNGKCKAS